MISKWISLALVSIGSVALTATMVARAEPATQPSGEHAKGEKRSGRWGYAPFNKLSGITDEQRMKISDIHRKFLAERKALEDKQDADVMALLTDDQKAELDKMKGEEKAKAAENRKNKKDKDKDKEEDDDKDKGK